jgi:murein L,D-transpeptidase YcbB/YkuD
MARLELLFTDAALLYASDLRDGRVDPSSVNEGWRARPRRTDLSRLLHSAVADGRVAAALAALAPAHRGYRQLREALAEYRRISAMGGWSAIPGGAVLRSGGSDARLPLLRERLLLSGDLTESDGSAGELFDAATEAALVRFQARHGLDTDGVLGAMTLVALNVSVEERIRQIEINMERWRWVRENLGSRHLQVNIADFSLQVVEQGRTVMSMPVVVGTSFRKTPLFSARMTYLEFAPYWTVPSTILREDKLPLIKRDPGWLPRHHYEIVRHAPGKTVAVDPSDIDWKEVEAKTFPGSLRQKPGPWNPLGRVKFMFPNRFAVYLHDTPDRYLFARDIRSFSSGCIRIERPLDLAQYLLEEKSGWDCDLILEAMKSEAPLVIGLPASLPVHILYWTAWVDEGGLLQFRKDFYLRDLDLDLALLEETAVESGRGEGKPVTAGP